MIRLEREDFEDLRASSRNLAAVINVTSEAFKASGFGYLAGLK